jgi:hypothetical protein
MRYFKIKIYLICLIFLHPQHLAALAVNMQSSKENSRKNNNDLDKRGNYQQFEDRCRQMRELVIKFYAKRVIAHAASNGKSCHQGFDGAAQLAPFMRITRNDINNKVRAIQGQGLHKCEQREVSPAPIIPFHVICDPSLSTNLDLSVSAQQMNRIR